VISFNAHRTQLRQLRYGKSGVERLRELRKFKKIKLVILSDEGIAKAKELEKKYLKGVI